MLALSNLLFKLLVTHEGIFSIIAFLCSCMKKQTRNYKSFSTLLKFIGYLGENLPFWSSLAISGKSDKSRKFLQYHNHRHLKHFEGSGFLLTWLILPTFLVPLTPLLPVYDTFVPKNHTWAAIFAPVCNPVDCTKELFKPSKDSASLRVCNEHIFGFGFAFFVKWHHKWGRFLANLAHVTWPRAQPQEGSISLKFLLETRL